MSYVPESNICVKSYDHSNFSRASAVQFRASWYIMSPNRTSVWKLMTIRISRELPLLNFEHLNEWCPRIGHPGVNLWPFEFLESFRCSILSVSICDVPESDLRVITYDHSNLLRASTFNFDRFDIWRDSIGHPSKKLLAFEFAQSFGIQVWASRYTTGLNQTTE